MKTIIAIIALSMCGSGFADVVVESPTRVLIDTVNEGTVAAVLVAHPQRAAEIQAALETWAANLHQQLAAAQMECTALANKARAARESGDTAAQLAVIAEAAASAVERQKMRLEARKAELQALIDQLEATSVAVQRAAKKGK